MQFDSVALIVAIEIAAVLLILLIIVFFQNRSLRATTDKLKKRMEELVEKLKEARSAPPQSPIPPPKTYIDFIDEALTSTEHHHASLEPDRDIVLDLAPDTALPKRAAALRYAVLLAEKAANCASRENISETDWASIREKYKQIFDFHDEDVDLPQEPSNDTGLEALNEELVNAKKRINNLEKFKALYFDLEEQWEQSKQDAQTSYNDLSSMASKTDDSEKFEQALANHHNAYNNVDRMIQVGIGDPEVIVQTVQLHDEESAGEIRHLRAVAADQHKTINELQTKLEQASSEQERAQIVETLQEELERQKRFMQESETCIQLMEVELQNAQKEATQLKGRLKTLPSIKTQLHELKRQKDEYELKVYALTSENRKLAKKASQAQAPTTADDNQASALKKELAQLQSNYTSLEEKYLDLKIGQ